MTDIIETAPRQRAAWEDIAILIVGGWLTFCAPTLEINSSTLDTSATVIAGLVLIILAAAAMRITLEWLQWGVIASGAALVAAPWVLGFTLKTAVINATASGIAVVVLAAWRVYEIRTRRVVTVTEVRAPGATEGAKANGEHPRQAA